MSGAWPPGSRSGAAPVAFASRAEYHAGRDRAPQTAGKQFRLRLMCRIRENAMIVRKGWAAGAAVLVLALMSVAALAADFPAPKEGAWTARDFKFHTGEVMPELKLAYTTVGEPSGEPVLVLHGTTGSAASMLGPTFGGELFGKGQPLDATQVLHHPPGRGRPRQIIETLRRPARQVPEIQLRRHGRGPLPADQGRPRHPPSAPGDRQLDGRHAHLAVGRQVSRRHGCARADGVAALRDGEPQLDAAPAAGRHHPHRSRLQERRLHRRSRAP